MLQNHKRNYIAIAVLFVVFIVGGLLAQSLRQGFSATRTASERFGLLQAQAKANPKRGVVPFLGPLKRGNCGVRVVALQNALVRVNVRKKSNNKARCYGKPTAIQVMRFQRRIHYKPTGRYTHATHLALVKRKGYSNKARRNLIFDAQKVYNVKRRDTIKRVAFHYYLVGRNSAGYTQSGQRASFPPWPGIPSATDCSGAITWIAYQSGFGAALGYYGPGSPVGWTGTMLNQGQIVPPNSKLRVGDIVFYPGHASLYIGSGKEISHGGVGVDIRPVGNYSQARRYFR